MGAYCMYCISAVCHVDRAALPPPTLQCLSNIREGRKRLTKADFEALAMIGRGAFGEVRLVRKRDTGEVSQLDSKMPDGIVRWTSILYRRRIESLLSLSCVCSLQEHPPPLRTHSQSTALRSRQDQRYD